MALFDFVAEEVESMFQFVLDPEAHHNRRERNRMQRQPSALDVELLMLLEKAKNAAKDSRWRCACGMFNSISNKLCCQCGTDARKVPHVG